VRFAREQEFALRKYKDRPAMEPIDFTKLPDKPLLTCSDFADVGEWDLSFCCWSCHEDESYGYDLISSLDLGSYGSYLVGEVALPDVRYTSVCCKLEEVIEFTLKNS